MKNAKNQQLIRKQRISKIKTQHDEAANINYELLLQESKKLHHKQIKYVNYAHQKTDHLFPLKPVQIGFIQSLTLKDDPKFKEVRQLLQLYNQEVLQYNQKSAPGLHLKTVVIDSMVKFMRLMLQAPDANAKKLILDVSYYWFKKNLDVSKQRRRTKRSLQKQIRKIVVESNLVPKAIIDRQLPSQKRKQELNNYDIKARTKYSEIDPPTVQLENYITHKLGYSSQNQKGQSENENPNRTKEELREQKWKKRIIFKKPYIEPPNYDQLQQEQLNEDQKGNLLKEKQQNLPPNTENKDLTQNVGQNNQQINPNGPSTNPPANEPIVQQQDLGLGEENDPAEDQVQQVEEEEKQVRGKLDPLVKIFLLDRQKRIKTQGQVSAQNRYNLKRNWKVQQSKLDQMNRQVITQWAGNRSRYKSELSRKIQSIRAFTSISKAKYQLSANPIRVQNTINRANLNSTLKQYGAYLQHEPVRESLNTEQSMSLYDRKRIKTEASLTAKPFSSVLQDQKRIDQKSQYLQQIQLLKQKFAKYKLYTPLDNFKKAIIHPEQKQCIWSQLDKQLSTGIQLPRCQMISNPFAKFAKKKKKKGKKKK